MTPCPNALFNLFFVDTRVQGSFLFDQRLHQARAGRFSSFERLLLTLLGLWVDMSFCILSNNYPLFVIPH